MLDKLTKFIEKYLAEPSERFTENKYIEAIHDSFFAILPIILIGSFFLALTSILRFCGQ